MRRKQKESEDGEFNKKSYACFSRGVSGGNDLKEEGVLSPSCFFYLIDWVGVRGGVNLLLLGEIS